MFARCFILGAALLIPLCLTAVANDSSSAPNYAERLGWPAGTRVVIFHVDDAGMSHESNMGTTKAIEKGLATSCSIMMPCSWVPEMAARCKANPKIDAGIHLTLTSEWKLYRWGPLAGRSVVPGLCDPEGYLWHHVADVTKNATADEFEKEIRAQIVKARDMGIRPTHLDTHMGTCFEPKFFDRYVKVGIETKIPIMIFGGHMQYIGKEAGPLKPLLRQVAQSVWDAGLPVIDDLVTKPTRSRDYQERKKELVRLLHQMKPGITQIIVHCTELSPVFSSISGSGPSREAELQLLLDPDIKQTLRDEGIELTTWRELAERRSRVKN